MADLASYGIPPKQPDRPKLVIAKAVYESRGVGSASKGCLAKHRLSDNVVPVKNFLSVLIRALRRARHFALAEKVPYQPRPARNPFQVRNSVRPMHLFGHTFDHDYYFELPAKGSGIPNQLLDVLLHTMAISRLSRVRTELFHLLVIPSLAHHPVKANRQFSCHRHLGDFPSAPHRQVDILT